jgi:hypothetical protein
VLFVPPPSGVPVPPPLELEQPANTPARAPIPPASTHAPNSF